MKKHSIKHRIDVAVGRKPADLLLKNCKVVSVLADEILKTDVAIADGVIVGFGNYSAKKEIDIRGGYLSAGLIDSHIHIESTLLIPQEFAKTVLAHGTTAVVADPHEIANVMGSAGIRWMIDASEGLPVDINVVLPSCVPASRFESPWKPLGSAELKKLSKLPRVIGIGEVMNYPKVIEGDADFLRKIRLIPGMRVDGHAPGLTGKDLNAYIAAGIHSDHESTKAHEAKEKLLAGLHIMIREGSSEKNLNEIAKIVTPANSHRCFFCSDDRSAHDLIKKGHIDEILRMAVRFGIPPITALQMATNNAPYYFRIKRRKGAVAIGYAADLVVFDSLKKFNARMVFKDGLLAAKDGEILVPCRAKKSPKIENSVNISHVGPDIFRVKAQTGKMRAIRIVPGQITTAMEIITPASSNGLIESDISKDILKVSVLERHHASGRFCTGFVRGFGLKKGAIASTVCHDAHNIVVVGTNDRDMMCAVMELAKCKGGFVATCGEKVIDCLPLPVAGLMSDMPASDVASAYARIEKSLKKLGAAVDDAFLTMSFLSLSVIPEIRITDRGIIDVIGDRIVPLFLK